MAKQGWQTMLHAGWGYGWRAKAPSVWTCAQAGLFFYLLTSSIVLIGVFFGQQFLPLQLGDGPQMTRPIDGLIGWDGIRYEEIAAEGYSYSPDRASTVAWFPLYPVLARLLSFCTGLSLRSALVALANACCLLGFVLLYGYSRCRCLDAPKTHAEFTLLAFGLFPMGLFFRMAHTESLFVAIALAVFLGMEARWPTVLVAALVGMATASRPVGIALVVPYLYYLREQAPSRRMFWMRCSTHLPLACSGIIAYAIYCWAAFGSPVAFATTQFHYRLRPPVPLSDQVESLLTLAPISDVYDPNSPSFWRYLEPWGRFACFSIVFANPIYFGLVVGLGAVGWVKGWLNSKEALLVGLLLAIPYATRSYEMSMGSMGRFTAVAFPIYLVMGQLLCRVGPARAAAIAGISAVFLAVFSALFARFYLVI